MTPLHLPVLGKWYVAQVSLDEGDKTQGTKVVCQLGRGVKKWRRARNEPMKRIIHGHEKNSYAEKELRTNVPTERLSSEGGFNKAEQ